MVIASSSSVSAFAYADIDTPELDGQCAFETDLATRARDRLVVLLNSESFEVRRQGQDRYGRTLAIVTNSRGSIGDQLVQRRAGTHMVRAA